MLPTYGIYSSTWASLTGLRDRKYLAHRDLKCCGGNIAWVPKPLLGEVEGESERYCVRG